MFERELSVLEGSHDGERISVMEIGAADEVHHVELRFEQEIGELGWVVQRRLRIDASQVSDLRLALTLFAASNPVQTAPQRVVSLADYQKRSA